VDPERRKAFLAANLACRERLGLGLVAGSQTELAQLISLLDPQATQPDKGLEGGLESVRAAMGECKRCPLSAGRRSIVFGQGPDRARVMFIGEGPGEQEDARGLPFVGPAGRLLDKMLQAVGLKRERVYITNIVKCRPPNNREPAPEEVAACRPLLEAQVREISPSVIVTLGRPAAQSLLASQAPISTLRGNWKEFMGVPLLPTFHPAFLLRQPERKREAYQDLKALARRLADSGGAA
jgi:DNA polymerase